MKIRQLTLGVALLASGTLIAGATQHIASADVSSGDRPVLISFEPCRLVDTRVDSQVGPRSAPLAAGDVHTVDAQEGTTPCAGKIATDASALSLNVTALRATQQTFLTIWAGGNRPEASSLNPAPGQPPVPNAVTTQLSVDQEFEVFNNRGSVHIVIDINGYYVNHDHDDRYPLKADSQAPVTVVSDELQSSAQVEDDGSFPRPGVVLYEFEFEAPAGTAVVEVNSELNSYFDDGGTAGSSSRGFACWLTVDADTTKIAETPLNAREKILVGVVPTWTAVVEVTTAGMVSTKLLCSPPADGYTTAQHPRAVATLIPS